MQNKLQNFQSVDKRSVPVMENRADLKEDLRIRRTFNYFRRL
jgi:ABC-type Fe3+-citrate transport system substrate-binding protein